MLNVILLIVLATTVTVVAGWLAMRVGWRWLRRVVERQVRHRQLTSGYALPEPTSASYNAALLTGCAQLVLLVVLAPRGDRDDTALALALALTVPVCVLLAIAAFALHGLPRHNRTLKYAALWMAMFLANIVLVQEQTKGLPGAHWVLLISPLALIVGTWIAWRFFDEHLTSGTPGRLAFVLHRMYMELGPAPGLRAALAFYALRAAGAFPVFLVLRYYLRPLVARRPILYLRSFHDREAHSFHGHILAPAVGSRAVVVGLIHETQTGEELHRATDQAWHGDIYALPETAWQRWVEHKLASCAAVVIDMSIPSRSLEWELAQALQHLPQERVLLVSRTTISPALAARGVETQAYALTTPEDRRISREAMTVWVDGVIRSVTAPREAPAAVGGPSAWRLPIACVVGALSLIAAFHSAIALAMIGPVSELVAGKGFAAAAFHRTWGLRQDAVNVAVAVLALVACASLTGRTRAVTRAARLGIGVPMALLGAISLLALAVRPGNAGTYAVDALASQCSVVSLGVLLTWCVHAHVAAAAPLDLERVLFRILVPASLGIATMFGTLIAGILRAPSLVQLLGVVGAIAPWIAFAALAQLLIRAGRLGAPDRTSIEVARATEHATERRA